MFGPLGFPELVFILVLALLIFGPKRLPEVGRTIGKGMAQFRRATTDLKRTIESEISLEEEGPLRPPARPAALQAPRRVAGPDLSSVPVPAESAADPESPGATTDSPDRPGSNA